jgi:hypothetical protein
MENNCKYISIRGLKRSCNFKSNVYLSDTQNGRDYLYDMIKDNKMFDGMSIFVVSDLLEFFVNEILDKIKHTFILVSGMSVKTSPVETLKKTNLFKLINNKYLIKWCSQNNTIQYYPKVLQVPLGIDFHSVYNNPKKWTKIVDGNSPVEQETYLIDIANKSAPFYERINKIYVNFNMNTDRFKQRKACLKELPQNVLAYHQEKMKRTQTWEQTVKYSFVLSPYGNGMDCHRHWEALILGSILIIKSKEFIKMFEDLPVLIVNDWREINQELLDSTIELFKNKTFNYDKLTLEYWKQQVFI